MSKRVCIFVDGENFRHSIVQLFENFDQADYLPKKANWADLFEWLVSRVSPGADRIRTYWYLIESLDFFPYNLPKPEKEPEKLKRLLNKNDDFKKELEPLEGQKLLERMKEIFQNLQKEQAKMRHRFDGWRSIQNTISARHAAVEFRRAGAIRYNLFDRTFGPEKAVDVKLAVDLIMLRDIYDIAVIVSGDQDYVPAVQVVKDSGKSVVNVAFETRGGKLLPQGAWRLNQVTDWSFNIPHEELGKHLCIDTATRPT